MWLPSNEIGPEPSPQLVRDTTGEYSYDEFEGEAGGDARDGPVERGERAGRDALVLDSWMVPTLELSPGPAVDALIALSGVDSGDVRIDAAVTVLGALAGLALEVVAAGRVIPDLVLDSDGQALAKWSWLAGSKDEDRVALLANALPASCRVEADLVKGSAVGEPGMNRTPREIAQQAFDAMVDAACRESFRLSSTLGATRSNSLKEVPVAEAWLIALGHQGPKVDGRRGELAKLERLVSEWRSSASQIAGAWRLCFRLVEPAGDSSEDDADVVEATGGSQLWRVEFLLQATEDLSLVVAAEEVWKAGSRLDHVSGSIDAPHERLLAELGRALRCYPELALALREAKPTGLDLDISGAHRFLSEIAPGLELAGFGVLLPAWWRNPAGRLGLKLRASMKSTAGQSGLGLLGIEGLCSYDWEAALGDNRITKAELRRLARLKVPLVQVRGQWVELAGGDVERLVKFLDARRGSKEDSQMSVGEVLKVAAGSAAGIPDIPVVGVDADGWLGALLRGEVEETLDVKGTPEGFEGELRPYQERGVAWMDLLGRLGLGACLADDMGLGKTAMVLALLEAERAEREEQVKRSGTRKKKGSPPAPSLVICPTSVVGNWRREAERFTPGLKVHVHHGATRASSDTFVAEVTGVDVVITSYALAARDRQTLSKLQWSRMILDEAQNVKNSEAKQTRAIKSLPAKHRVALTGTPVENHLGELWSIMELLNPGLLGSAKSFRERFGVPIERYRDEEAAERLRLMTRPFVLRRLKTDRTIITDLPEKLEMKVLCNLTREQGTLYQAVVDDMLKRIEETDGMERKGLVLATMLRLKQVCNHPALFLADGSALAGRSGKLERTIEVIGEVLDNKEKALVFTQYAGMGRLLQEHMQHRLGERVDFLHGGVSRKQRDAMVEEFQGDGVATVMVLSLKAGGTGLNLTAANHVVHFDRWWNPAVEDQATDRSFRIGQLRDVQVRKLVCVGTLEERIDQMIEAKKDLADRIVGSGEAWLTEMSTDELAEVFALSADAMTDV